jgi:hypothetical protein
MGLSPQSYLKVSTIWDWWHLRAPILKWESLHLNYLKLNAIISKLNQSNFNLSLSTSMWYHRRDVRSLGRGPGVLSWIVYLATLRQDACNIEGDGSVVIVASFFGPVGQFLPQGAPNSRLWRRSCTHKWYPHAITSSKPWQCTNILANSIPQGLTLIKKLFDKIGEGGGFGSPVSAE